jgi:uncharacterized protein
VIEAIANVVHALSGAELGWIVAGALAGGLVNGLSGFGTGITGLPFWVQALEPVLASQLAAGSAVTSQLFTFGTMWRSVDARRVAPMIAAGLAGVPIGLGIQPHIDQLSFKLTVGAILLVYAAIMLIADGRLRLTVESRAADMAVGLISGVLGGIAGISGVFPTIWAAVNNWPKERRRSTFQAFNLTILAVMMLASWWDGRLGLKFAAVILVSLPTTLIGVAIGSAIYRRLDDRRFDRIVLGLLLVSGLALLWPLYADFTYLLWR